MNTLLIKLFDIYNISLKNRHEINKIYALLPPNKRYALIHHFESFAHKIGTIELNLQAERNILVPNIIERINDLEGTKNEARIK